MLKQEPVGRVGVDLDPGLRDQAREQVQIVRQDHRIAVAVRDQHRQADAAQSLQQGMVRDPPGADRVDAAVRRQSVNQGRIPVVEVPAEVLQKNQRDRALTLIAVGVVDPVRSP